MRGRGRRLETKIIQNNEREKEDRRGKGDERRGKEKEEKEQGGREGRRNLRVYVVLGAALLSGRCWH